MGIWAQLSGSGFLTGSNQSVTKDFSGGPAVKTSPPNAGGSSSNPVQGPKILHALGAKRKQQTNMKQKQYCNKFNKVFKNGPHKQQQQPEQIKNKQTKKKTAPKPQSVGRSCNHPKAQLGDLLPGSHVWLPVGLRRSTPKLIHQVIGRTEFLEGCWTEDLRFLQAVGCRYYLLAMWASP